MAWDLTVTLAALLVAANLVVGTYLLVLFRGLRVELERLREAQPASEEIEATRTLLEQVALEIGRVAGEIEASAEESEERRLLLVERIDALTERLASLESKPSQAPLPAPESHADGQAAPEPEPTVVEEAAVPAPPQEADVPARALFRKKGERVRALHEQGKSLADIARETKLSGGEVELILGLGERLGEPDTR
jgi:hypothetical protein